MPVHAHLASTGTVFPAWPVMAVEYGTAQLMPASAPMDSTGMARNASAAPMVRIGMGIPVSPALEDKHGALSP